MMDFQPLFADWPDTRTCEPGEAVFDEGEAAVAMYFVLDGEVEMRRHGAAMSVEGPGGIIGESALLGSAAHNGAAVASAETRLARLDRDQLRQLMEGNADFALHVMARLALRLRSVDSFISARIAAEKQTSER